MPGPLPNPQRRRRNAPTIPTTNLPASGRAGRPPKCPYQLGKAGSTWWRWAWRTPQAAAWSLGDLYTAGRRARLEDDLAALRDIEGLDLHEALDALDEESGRRFRDLVQSLASMATGQVTLMREARELDDRLGLTPKSLAALRWTILDDEKAKPAEADPDEGPQLPSNVRRLRAVDPAAQAQ